jgi:opacity protein-like surface antigen
MFGLLSVGVLVAAPLRAEAQEQRVPEAGSFAAGVSVGVLVPVSDELSTGALASGHYEYYETPRHSVRTAIGRTNPSIAIGAVDSLMQTPLQIDANYNWEGGRWHPFVGAGVGVYFLQFRSDPMASDNRETRFGFNTGGGIEYFVTRRLALKGEGRYHAVPDVRGEEPSGTALTLGLKTFF